jgi:hypothetical protein
MTQVKLLKAFCTNSNNSNWIVGFFYVVGEKHKQNAAGESENSHMKIYK